MMIQSTTKSLFALFVLGCFGLQAMSSPITRQQAQQNALSFLQERGKSVAMSSLRHAPTRATQYDELQPYYLFNIGNNQGYVIASGDDCAYAVLGYSDSGYIDVSNIPCNMQWWLDEYARQIKFMQQHGSSTRRAPKKSPIGPAIPKMLTCEWSQHDPYNQNCPVDANGNRCITGCVATAMAQVMYYHRANSVNRTTREIPGYVTNTLGISVAAIPAGSFIDWDNMLDRYETYYWESIDFTEQQKNAVANLMKYCGTAIEIDYTPHATAGYVSLVPNALMDYFNYSSKIKRVFRDDFEDEDWENMIYSELSASRPVFYSGDNSDDVGHAFVCDGYDGNGYYHFNLGWGIYFDSYYLLTAVPSDEDLIEFCYDQDAIIHMNPRTNVPPTENFIHFIDPIVERQCIKLADYNDDGVVTFEEAAEVTDFNVSYSSLRNITSFDEFEYFTGLKTIERAAFFYCRKLRSIKIPNSIITIKEGAFQYCSQLDSIIIPNSVVTIENCAFDMCDSLKSVTIGKSVAYMEDWAFFSTGHKLTNVTCYAHIPPEASYYAFSWETYPNATLKVPIDDVETYKNTYPWNCFSNIVGFGPYRADVNLDGEIGIADINALIHQIITGDYNGHGDVNLDGEITVADINVVIDKILSSN